MLLAVPHLLAASVCTSLIADGGPGWLNLLVPSARNGRRSDRNWPRNGGAVSRVQPPGQGLSTGGRMELPLETPTKAMSRDIVQDVSCHRS